LGTYSYGSNGQLSITSEMAAIHKNFPHIEITTLLQWATLNGAKALQWENDIGSFEKGRRPGVVLLQNDLSASRRVI
jgi:cytosine/adenosine deaminase-related metal-dependent hydrolase